MNQDIHSNLEKLKVELSKLEPAVKHLQRADENATSLIESISKIHEEYTLHLNSLEKMLAQTNRSHHKQLSLMIEASAIKLTDTGNMVAKSFKSVEKEVNDLLDEYKFLSSETDKLVNKIDKVDFPIRLDNLDSNVNSINQILQNIRQRLGDLERIINVDFTFKIENFQSKIESTENSIKKRIENSDKEFAKMFEKNLKVSKILKFLLLFLICLNLVIVFKQFL